MYFTSTLMTRLLYGSWLLASVTGHSEPFGNVCICRRYGGIADECSTNWVITESSMQRMQSFASIMFVKTLRRIRMSANSLGTTHAHSLTAALFIYLFGGVYVCVLRARVCTLHTAVHAPWAWAFLNPNLSQQFSRKAIPFSPPSLHSHSHIHRVASYLRST